ncbi:YtxH domain-containing protein [Pedobacter fastidiosus]|uniref:YtxH domain-containing protein n=1 Tax=Pedobacter fastidiosus TaxID=2765361 RepID=A0ABR7KUT8_9SPHI|nr:YtxH domain-containing protein [Pedobacter fastidiosus]MBC6111684.1 YtxH domain-containing protein [Pedobacter fastidiosus]
MSLLKYAILGAAAVYGFKYATKKRETDGKSLVDDFKENAPDFINKAKEYGNKVKNDYTQTSDLY